MTARAGHNPRITDSRGPEFFEDQEENFALFDQKHNILGHPIKPYTNFVTSIDEWSPRGSLQPLNRSKLKV